MLTEDPILWCPGAQRNSDAYMANDVANVRGEPGGGVVVPGGTPPAGVH